MEINGIQFDSNFLEIDKGKSFFLFLPENLVFFLSWYVGFDFWVEFFEILFSSDFGFHLELLLDFFGELLMNFVG
jgi:hypothetical protein